MLEEAHGIALASGPFLSDTGVEESDLTDVLESERNGEERFDPKSVSDGRRLVLAEIVRRQGQDKFRQSLMKAYSNKCAMTGCDTSWVLEAAHVTPYRGSGTNSLQNGLLLRADVHTLFDLSLVSVSPSDRTIQISKALQSSIYWELQNRPLRQTTPAELQPSEAALALHFSQFKP